MAGRTHAPFPRWDCLFWRTQGAAPSPTQRGQAGPLWCRTCRPPRHHGLAPAILIQMGRGSGSSWTGALGRLGLVLPWSNVPSTLLLLLLLGGMQGPPVQAGGAGYLVAAAVPSLP